MDVDGVLADTRAAVRKAYARAGVEQPEEAWGISWKIWLPALVGDRAAEVHVEKQHHYAALLAGGAADRLPGADMAKALADAGHSVHFVTAASEVSASAVLRTLGLAVEDLWACELSPSDRVKALRDIHSYHHMMERSHGTFTYVDDREEGAAIAAEAGYGFVHARWTR